MIFVFCTLEICSFALLAFTEIVHFRAFFTIEITFAQNQTFFKSLKNPYGKRLQGTFSIGFEYGVATSTIKALYHLVWCFLFSYMRGACLPFALVKSGAPIESEVNGSLLTIDARSVTSNLLRCFLSSQPSMTKSDTRDRDTDLVIFVLH